MTTGNRDTRDIHFDFTAQSERFLETFFKKGAEFTSQLLAETQRMRDRIAELTEENAQLRTQLASDDAVRDLLATIQKLEEEKMRIRKNADDAVREFRDYEDRYAEMERELDQMANLYVASSQLHPSMNPEDVFSVIEQMLMQLVGAAKLAVFLRVPRTDPPVLRPAHLLNCDGVRGTEIRWGESPVGEAAATQVPFVSQPQDTPPDTPIACIPMIFAAETIGVIVIYELLEQKDRFVDMDFELFRLLSAHSSSAIAASGVLSRLDSPLDALDALATL